MIEISKLSFQHNIMLAEFFDKINCHRYTDDFLPHPFDELNANRVCNYSGKDFYYAVILNNTKIVGYFMLRGWDEGYAIPSIGLCVLDEFQGIGLGRLIMNQLEVLALLNGAAEVMLKVTKNNQIARNLYESQGFNFQEYNERFLVGYKKLRTKRIA